MATPPKTVVDGKHQRRPVLERTFGVQRIDRLELKQPISLDRTVDRIAARAKLSFDPLDPLHAAPTEQRRHAEHDR
ncbi:MAG: hypothetical protein AB7O24_09380 [Kofleriaceae bacterium]